MSKFTFEKQAQYFEKKLNLPTNTYLDIMGKEHDYFFVVAGANRNEILNGLREAVDNAILKGGTLEEFRKDFDKNVEKMGWQYNGGRNWRTRIIYDTNVYGAYNRGRLEQHLELKDVMPYWEYVHNDNSHPRPQHVAWHGKILRADDPWWKYYYPTKAYRCHCTVVAHDDDDLKAMGRTVEQAPEIDWEEKTVGIRSGNVRTVKVPKGYDVGFQPHNFENLAAQRNTGVDKVLMQKMITADPKFASAAILNVMKEPEVMALLNNSMAQMVEVVNSEKMARGEMKLVGVLQKDIITELEALNKAPQSAVIAIRDNDLLHALRESKVEKGTAIPQVFWEKLPEKLQNPSAIFIDKNHDKTLLFIFDIDKSKVAIKMDFEVKTKDVLTGKRYRAKLNLVRTGSIMTEKELNEKTKDFEKIK
ncbi:phage minor head protein [Pasteurella skyensis]|uniref:Phage minor head protein n=1 Tax=Phocoenobacter skyensis TaxID=97481 RepID=A0AAJ6N9B5_9PAST|nr:phage minor head protein [Pasteurella skyensis]MDP8162814.1 phage minor head protein [Pasteurella skyensis]MDP8172599.1 phage minor head protein [Pasteurella skyensis]MDP8179099.1 phage minor head protein [Pasteurella skyensis]MDP8183216.1 phage minor head protein [Pasteurella skyensis]MDP8189267.1 phage minor head protein [Pasteurella skyensis]